LTYLYPLVISNIEHFAKDKFTVVIICPLPVDTWRWFIKLILFDAISIGIVPPNKHGLIIILYINYPR